MLKDSVLEVLQHEGPVAIVTHSDRGPHLVATWASYIEIVDDTRLAIPAGGYRQTEQNLEAGSPVQMLLASRDVKGSGEAGTGFRLTGHGTMVTEGDVYEQIHDRFNWARAALVIRVDKIAQLI
ncbi:MAG: pyridoxamine 5'-phosphate oxidase family protein [Anaerolineae bacterium]